MQVKHFLQGKVTVEAVSAPLIFVHINKTAGTSFSHMLFDMFPKEKIAPAYRGDFAAIDLSNPEIRLYHGHMRFADWFHHGKQALPLCMLREPVARIISQYKSFSEAANADDAARWKDPVRAAQAVEIARDGNFDDFLLSDVPMIRGHCDNLQTQFLSINGRAQLMEDAFSAVETLRRNIFFFGITEEYEDSLNLLSWQLGNEEIPRLPPRNVSRDGRETTVQAVSDVAKDRIAEYTRWDRILYDAARDIFSERLLHAMDGET